MVGAAMFMSKSIAKCIASISRKRRRDSAGVPAHRGLGWTAVAASARGRKSSRKIPHHRVRHALAWQIKSAGSWTGEEYATDDARYTRRCAHSARRSGWKSRRDGLLDRRPHRSHLAIDHAAEFRALIGLEAAIFQAPWYDTSWLHRPDVHGGEVCAALVSGLIAPQSPEASRRETLWAYMQSGPGVFKGDLYFYRVDGDLRAGSRKSIPACVRFICSPGEYDFSCMPEDTLRTAAAIPGASVAIMEQLGHFPMSENPEQFRRYIAPVLAKSSSNRHPPSKENMYETQIPDWLRARRHVMRRPRHWRKKLTGTLKNIKETGAITIGYRESSVPFSYLDDNQKPVGYAMDICYKIVDAVKKELSSTS